MTITLTKPIRVGGVEVSGTQSGRDRSCERFTLAVSRG